MPHVHYHCGGIGEFVEEKPLIFRIHSAVGVGVSVKHDGFKAAGVSDEDFEKFSEMVERDIHKWYKRARKLGLEAHYYPPHPDNLPDDP